MKLFEHFGKLSTPTGFVFLQETHSSADVEKKWNDDLKIKFYFLTEKQKEIETTVCLLIIQAKVENEYFLLLNIYRANRESEQLSTLSDISNMLEKADDVANKKLVLGGDFSLFFEVKLESQGSDPVLKKNL